MGRTASYAFHHGSPRDQVGFTSISNALLWAASGLSDAAKLTYILISSLDWQREAFAQAWWSQSKVAALRGVSTRAIRRHLRELRRYKINEQRGLVDVEFEPATNRYTITIWDLPARDYREALAKREALKQGLSAQSIRELSKGGIDAADLPP